MLCCCYKTAMIKNQKESENKRLAQKSILWMTECNQNVLQIRDHTGRRFYWLEFWIFVRKERFPKPCQRTTLNPN